MAVEFMTRKQYNTLKAWYDANNREWPDEINRLFKILFGLFHALVTMNSRHQQVLTRLREAMGFTPKSESGRQLTKRD